MRHTALFLAVLVLNACSTVGASVTYTVTTDVTDEGQRAALLEASERVIERRLATIGEEAKNVTTQTNGTVTTITVKAKTPEALGTLSQVLLEPFALDLMTESSAEDADVVIEGHGGFEKSPVNQDLVDWFEATEEPAGKGRVTITFTEEGRKQMNTLFEENQGKFLGLFVRNMLVSKLLVETDKVLDDIIITDIPTFQLAQVFADDVNVGMHVTFSLAQ